MINKNEIAKTYIQIKSAETNKLSDLVLNYKVANVTAIQVYGDDVFSSVPYVACPQYDRSRT